MVAVAWSPNEPYVGMLLPLEGVPCSWRFKGVVELEAKFDDEVEEAVGALGGRAWDGVASYQITDERRWDAHVCVHADRDRRPVVAGLSAKFRNKASQNVDVVLVRL